MGTTASASAAAPSCKGTQLTVSFSIIRGSHAAGTVLYALRLKNSSDAACAVSGLPGLQLLGKTGEKLPTHVSNATPGVTAVVVALKPGFSAWSEGRFSPDIPGSGEGHPGQCELTAYKVAVTVPPLGIAEQKVLEIVGPVVQPTSVCSHGAISLGLLGSKKPTV